MLRTKKISADEAHEARKDHLRGDADGREILLKVAKAPSSWDATKRSARFIMTSQAVDRYGDVVVTAGLDISEFEKNPMVFVFHKSNSWSVGTWANIEKQLRGRPPRMEGDAVLHPPGGPVAEVDQAAWMIEHGGLRASSIGFIPDFEEVELILDETGSPTGGLQFNKAEIVECSLVGIPANPQALAKALEANVKLPQEFIEDVLDAWARSPEGKLIARDDFEKTYQLIKTAGDDAGMAAELLGRLDEQAALTLCEKHIVARGKTILPPGHTAMPTERVVAIERAAKNKRLAEKRQREMDAIRTRGV